MNISLNRAFNSVLLVETRTHHIHLCYLPIQHQNVWSVKNQDSTLKCSVPKLTSGNFVTPKLSTMIQGYSLSKGIYDELLKKKIKIGNITTQTKKSKQMKLMFVGFFSCQNNNVHFL